MAKHQASPTKDIECVFVHGLPGLIAGQGLRGHDRDHILGRGDLFKVDFHLLVNQLGLAKGGPAG